MRYVEAIHHARSGGTAYLEARVIRLLTAEEATPILLEQRPSRRILRNEDGSVKTEGSGKDEKIVVETYVSAEPYELRALGLYDVSGDEPIEFRPTDEDIYEPVELDAEGKPKPRVLRTDWEIVSAEVPAVVDPEVVDEVLNETTIDTEPPQ